MKSIYLLIIVCFITLSVKSQTKAENKVALAVETFKAALLSGNKADLENITAADLSYGHSTGKIEDKAAFVESLASGKSDFITMDFTEQKITISGNTALVRHKLSAQINDGGKPGSINLGVLLVFQKQHGGWKLLARQAFKL